MEAARVVVTRLTGSVVLRWTKNLQAKHLGGKITSLSLILALTTTTS